MSRSEGALLFCLQIHLFMHIDHMYISVLNKMHIQNKNVQCSHHLCTRISISSSALLINICDEEEELGAYSYSQGEESRRMQH